MKTLISFLIVLCLVLPVFGTDFYVDNEHGNVSHDGLAPDRAKKTIADGLVLLNSANPGDVLHIIEGTYLEGNLVVNATSLGTPLKIVGEGRVIIKPIGKSYIFSLSTNVDGLIIENLIFDASSGISSIIKILGGTSENISILNNTFICRNNQTTPTNIIRISNSTNSLDISGNVFFGFPNVAIIFTTGNHNDPNIIHNSFIDNDIFFGNGSSNQDTSQTGVLFSSGTINNIVLHSNLYVGLLKGNVRSAGSVTGLINNVGWNLFPISMSPSNRYIGMTLGEQNDVMSDTYFFLDPLREKYFLTDTSSAVGHGKPIGGSQKTNIGAKNIGQYLFNPGADASNTLWVDSTGASINASSFVTYKTNISGDSVIKLNNGVNEIEIYSPVLNFSNPLTRVFSIDFESLQRTDFTSGFKHVIDNDDTSPFREIEFRQSNVSFTQLTSASTVPFSKVKNRGKINIVNQFFQIRLTLRGNGQ